MSRAVAQNDLIAILNQGSCIIIDARGRNAPQLISLAASAAASGGTITIRAASTLSASDLLGIAASGKGRVIFDFT